MGTELFIGLWVISGIVSSLWMFMYDEDELHIWPCIWISVVGAGWGMIGAVAIFTTWACVHLNHKMKDTKFGKWDGIVWRRK